MYKVVNCAVVSKAQAMRSWCDDDDQRLRRQSSESFTFQPGAVTWTRTRWAEGPTPSGCRASSGFPFSVCVPLTTQCLLPKLCRIFSLNIRVREIANVVWLNAEVRLGIERLDYSRSGEGRPYRLSVSASGHLASSSGQLEPWGGLWNRRGTVGSPDHKWFHGACDRKRILGAAWSERAAASSQRWRVWVF